MNLRAPEQMNRAPFNEVSRRKQDFNILIQESPFHFGWSAFLYRGSRFFIFRVADRVNKMSLSTIATVEIGRKGPVK
jgi:hypothetical protein